MKYIAGLLGISMLCIPVCQARGTSRQDSLNQRLITAIKRNDPRQVRFLLSQGADPNAHQRRAWKQIPEDQLPTEIRLSKRRTGVKPPSALLIALGMLSTDDPNYYQAKRQKNSAIIKALVKAGANVNEPDADNGLSPLMLSIIGDGMNEDEDITPQDRKAVVEVLLQHRSRIEATDKQGGTALMGAAMFPKREEIIKLLLAHGSNPNAMSYRGDRPLTLVRQANYIPLLVHYGADINAKDRKGQTVLARVKKEQDLFFGASDEVVKELCREGAK